MTDNWQIIQDLYKGFGNNPRNAETFDAMANINPLMSAYRGVKSLADVDPKVLSKALLNEAYGLNDNSVNRAAGKEMAKSGLGVLDIAPMAGALKPAIKPTAKALGKALAMTENLPVGMSIKDVNRKLTSFEEALNLAQQRAALPVSEGGLGLPANNTAMDRAKAMGNTTKAYTGANIEGEIDSMLPKSWFSKEPEYSSTYSTTIPSDGISKNPRVYPVLINTGKIKSQPYFGLYEDMEKALSKKGVNTFKIENVGGGINDFYVPKEGSQVRSIFAAFDPFRRNENDILAGVGALPFIDYNKKDNK